MNRSVQTKRRLYRIVEDTQWIYRALITGRVVDEITGQPEAMTYSLQFDQLHIETQIGSSGFFCLSGYPERAFPNLDTTNYEFDITIQAAGYEKRQFPVQVPAGSVFPIRVPDIRLAPNPIRIQGKVTTPDGEPVPGARVLLAPDPNPAIRPLGLRTPLATSHPLGTQIHRRALIPTGPTKQLTAPAPAGSNSPVLDSHSALAAGDVLQIGPEETGVFRQVESLPGPGNPNPPGLVLLTLPLTHSFPAGAPVRRVDAAAITFTTRLARPARQGSGILLLDDPLIDESIQIGAEFHRIGALSDARGDYRIDGVEGLKTIFLVASAAGFNPMVEPMEWTVDYGEPVNIVNLQLP